MAKAKKGDATQHLINDHFLPDWQDNRSNTLAAHQELHGGASQYPLPGHTHDVVGRSTYSEAKPREGYSQGAMANQELGKDRRSSDHPANAERNAELARRYRSTTGGYKGEMGEIHD